MVYSRDRKPQVPEGWVAHWDDESSKWYYGKLVPVTQWEAPEGTIFAPQSDLPPYEETVHCDADGALDPALELHSLEGQYEQVDVQQHLLSSQSGTPPAFSRAHTKTSKFRWEFLIAQPIMIIILGGLFGLLMGGSIKLLVAFGRMVARS